MSVSFGGVRALRGVSVEVKAGEVVSLIGPNGAGKSTVFNVISRIVNNDEGRVRARGVDITREAPHSIVRHGIARTYQGLQFSAAMTVGETLLAGQHSRLQGNALASALRLPAARRAEAFCEVKARDVAKTLGVDTEWDSKVSSLPYGVQKRVDIGRALVSEPSLLLLDEPAAGLNDEALDELSGQIKRVQEEFETAVLVVEHHMPVVMGISDRIYVLNFGQLIAEGSPQEIRANPAVIEAYLGTGRNVGHA